MLKESIMLRFWSYLHREEDEDFDEEYKKNLHDEMKDWLEYTMRTYGYRIEEDNDVADVNILAKDGVRQIYMHEGECAGYCSVKVDEDIDPIAYYF